jgi:HK97 gp10 family phage protein
MATMKTIGVVKVEGLRELEQSLKTLPRAVARNVLRRVLTKRGEPMAETMRELAPDDPTTGPHDLHRSIFVSTKIKNDVGKAEYAQVMRSGGTKDEAVAALRTARRDAAGEGSFAEVYIGPDAAHNFYGRFQEFGTSHNAPQPFMRPAWDRHKDGILKGIQDDLWAEIEKAAQRQAKRAG